MFGFWLLQCRVIQSYSNSILNYFFISALFLIRDDEFTESLPGEIKDAFVDDNDFVSEKMKKLKEMLKEHFPVCTYQVLLR